MRKFSATEDYSKVLGNLRDSPSKEAVKSLERIKKRKRASNELRGMIDFL